MTDDLKTCTACRNCVNRRCTNAATANLGTKAKTVDLGRELASMPQRCPGFAPRYEGTK
jgi:hypothetical protein